MSENKRISDFDQVSSIASDDEFILVDKSNTTDLDASDTGKTVKINFADLKSALYTDRLPASTSQMVEAWHMGPSYAYSASTFESDGTPTNWIYQMASAQVIDGFYKRYPNSNYNYTDFISGESRIMKLKENGVFDMLTTTTSMSSSDRVDHDLLFYDYYDNYIGKWKFYSSGSNYIIELYDNNETLVHTFQDRPWMRGSSYGGGRVSGTFKIKDNQLKYFPWYTAMASKYHGGTEMLTEDIPNWTSTHIKSIKVVIHNVRGTHPAAYGWLKVGNGYNSCLFDYNGHHSSINSWRNSGEFWVY